MMMKKLIDDATVVRTKNAGPFTLTYDVLFVSRERYLAWEASEHFLREEIARTLRRDPEDVEVIWYPPANAVKIVVPRLLPAGSWGDSDIFGCQQHAPLLALELPA
jgi:hypothetical protein